MRILSLLFFIALLSGCASPGVRDPSLALQVTPQPVLRGQPALARVAAPAAARKVVGTVLVHGSPQLIFRKDEEEGDWFFYGTIPFSPWVKPGTYKVRVSVELPEGKPRYTEMELDLR